MKVKFIIAAAAAIAAPPIAAQETDQPPVEAAAPETAPEAAQAGPAAAADLVEGAEVRGVDGTVIGAIEAADAEGATVVSGAARLRLPLDNFQKDGQGLRIGATRDQFLAAAQPS